MKNEFRFYTCLILGYSLMIIGIFTPPIGVINASVIFGAGLFLVIAAACIGLDLREVLKEIRLLRDIDNKKIDDTIKENSDE